MVSDFRPRFMDNSVLPLSPQPQLFAYPQL